MIRISVLQLKLFCIILESLMKTMLESEKNPRKQKEKKGQAKRML